MFKKLLLTSAIALAAGSVSTAANAADLGGDCCADLEERVAVLEATTARKGNRKVSLTISGWVTQQLLVWDDSIDSDAYVGTSLEDLGTRLHFDGNAKINSEYSAGYSIRLNINNANGFLQDANDDDAGTGISILNSYMWVKSEVWGKVSWGLQSQATDDIHVDLSGAGSLFAANLVIFDGAGFALVPEGSGARGAALWRDIGFCHSLGIGIFGDCNGDRSDVIRYDTPTIGGFVVSASWGEDDLYDIALRYNGAFGDFKVAAGFGYSKQDDEIAVGSVEYTQGSFSALHVPSGIFVVANGGVEQVDAAGVPDGKNFYSKVGIRQNINSLGSTVFYGEYGVAKDAFSPTADFTAFGIGAITGSEFTRYGLGVVQEIDMASMAIWAKWKHYEGELDGVTGSADTEELDMFIAGGVIFF